MDELEKQVKKAARSVALQWPSVITADDAEQEIWVRLLESPGSLSKVLGMERRAQYRAVVGMGHQIASQERADYDYYKGQYRYSVKEVKGVLNHGILFEQLPAFKAEKLDILDSLEGIAEQYKAAILSRYVGQAVPLGKSGQHALNRGLEALVDEMNAAQRRSHSERDEGPGTREPIGRESARFLSKEVYDNDRQVLPSHLRDNGTEKEIWEAGSGRWR